MLNVKHLVKRFYNVDVLSSINLDIAAGEVVGLIGHSGAGKSTLARCLVGLEKPQSGRITLDGHVIEPGSGSARQEIQYLWQDAMQALSPYISAHAAVLETLHGFGIGSRKSRAGRATELLTELGIDAATARRKPHALSGGQAQRIALARALAAEPKLLILDEPLASLDLPNQIGTINVLRQLHTQQVISMLIVSHDLAPLRQLANRIVLLDKGQIVEDLPLSRFHTEARHPLSRAYIKISGSIAGARSE